MAVSYTHLDVYKRQGSFNVPTGNVVAPPCEVPLRTYQVILKGEDVFVDLSRNAAGAPG